MIYDKLLSLKYSARKTKNKTKKTEAVEENLPKLRNIKRAMKYTQIQFLLKLVLVRNNYIQKSD